MKKIILSGIVLLAVNAIFAQKSNVQFGVKGGVNFANLSDDVNGNSDSRTGVNVGGLAHIHLSKTFAVQPEVVFSMQGAEYNNGTTSKLNYINVPVLAQYMFEKGFRLQTGPQIGFLTSAKNEQDGTELNVNNSVKSTDLAWSFGAGYITNSGLGVDARYNLGLTDITKSNTSDVKNRVWQVGLFYQFRH